jgi:integrase
MASIQKHGSKWRVQVYAHGTRDSKILPTKQQAAAWALEREAELTGKKLPDKTWADAMKRYAEEVAPDHRGARWEVVRLKSLQADPMARRKLAGLAGNDFADWRDSRLKKRKPGTVAREMNLMRSVLESARRDWHWIKHNPMTDVRWPQTPKGRARRITPEEEKAVKDAFGVAGELVSETATQRVGLAFLFALETAMRSGEIVALQWPDVHLKQRYVVLPKTKNGDRREVPLTTRAVQILEALPVSDGPVFGLDGEGRDALWRKYRPKEIADLHFHDTRGEAIWRLSKKLDVLQLARVIGHRDPRSLMIYYRESAEDMAKRLD